jgi:hypothetical protein
VKLSKDERKARLIERPHECADEYARRTISYQNWSLNFNEIRQDPWRVKGGRGDFTQLQKDFIIDDVHFQCTGATHVVDEKDGWGERNKGAFGVIHVEDELEASLDKF